MVKTIKIFVNINIPDTEKYDGKTGSLVRFVEIFKQFKKTDENIRIVFNVTECMEQYFKKNNLEAKYGVLKSTLKFKNFTGFCLKTFFLTSKSLFVFGIPKTKDVGTKLMIYTTSDLFWEVIPAWVYKTRNKKIEWVQVIHHIYPNWKTRPGSKIVSFCGYYLQRFSLFLIKSKANKIILMNNLIRGELLKRGFPMEKMHISSNGLDFDYLNSILPSKIAYEGVFLGRMNASKGINDLLLIWKKVCEKMPAAKLAIIGGSEKTAKAKLIQDIKNSGLEKNIEVLGFLPDEQAFALLKASRVFVSPSHEEGWGIAIAEACGCGVPVVSWDLPVYSEIFEEHILAVKENDVDAFAEQVIKLLAENNSRQEIGDKGREFIKKYSWSEVARRELSIIKA